MKKTLIVIILFTILGFSLSVWWIRGSKPVDQRDKSTKIFVVRTGQGVREIANSLKHQGLISDPVIFFLIVKKLNLDGKIQAGDFRLSPSQNAEEIAKSLTHGTLDVWITIPEGKRAEEVAQILQKSVPTYQESWPTILSEHEGYLFPDTYLVPRDADIQTIVSIMQNNFKNKYAKIVANRPPKQPQEEIIILASLVEREAKLEKDRPLIASVLLNRLEIGMALQVDATVQYALGYQNTKEGWWKRQLTIDDVKVKSPYNTYENPGLPPGPIANPGRAVIEAVINPAQTNYLYYLADNSGVTHYAKTLDEHNANIKKYGL